MRALNALARRSLFSRPLRTGLTILGIGLGIGVLEAALLLEAGMGTAVQRAVDGTMGRAELRVAAVAEAGLSGATLDALRGTPGVVAVSPELERRTYPAPALGSASSLPRAVTVLGVDAAADAAVHDRPLQAGSPIASGATDAALVSAELARDDGLAVGGSVTLNGSGGSAPATFRIVGVLATGTVTSDPAGRLVIVPLAAAQGVFATSGVDRADLLLADGTTPEAATTALEQRLHAEPYTVASSADLVASLGGATSGLRTAIAMLAAVALFGGAFLTFNTVAMTVAERARDIGLLRAAGMTRRQVVTMILISSVHLGVAGVVAGLVAGVALDALATAALSAAGLAARPELELTAGPMALGAVLGLAVVAAAAFEPALRASQIPPVEALAARLDQDALVRTRLGWLPAVLAVVGVAGLALWPGALSSAAGLVRPLGLYAFLVVLALLVPLVTGVVSRVLALLFRPLLPVEARLTRGLASRDRNRTSLTVAALAGSLAVLVATGGVAATARQAGTSWLAEVIPGDELLSSVRPIAFDEPIVGDLRAAAGVARLSPIGRFSIAAAGTRVDAAAVVGADLAADGRLVLVSGDRAAALAAIDAGGAVIVPQSVADRMGLTVGATLTAITAAGAVPLRVAGIAARTIPGQAAESVLVGWADATSRLGALGADALAVRFAPSATPADRATLNALAVGAALQPQSLDEIAGTIGGTIDLLAGLFAAFALVALLVAGLAIVNTTAMNVAGRRRELALLRAAGLTSSQAWRLVVLDAAILGLDGAILGVIGGLAAAGLLAAWGSGPVGSFAIPWLEAGLAAVVGVSLAVLAAAYPARVAARAPVVAALGLE